MPLAGVDVRGPVCESGRRGPWRVVHADFDVVIAGGSTAAFAAALSAASDGARVALIEPTDWVGGQLTSSGVPAIDEAWHKITPLGGGEPYNVSAIARTPPTSRPTSSPFLRPWATPAAAG